MTDTTKLTQKGHIFYDMAQDDYHAIQGTFSSSQLKDLLDDPEIFHRKYIAKTEERQLFPAFDIGHYFHTAILEPDKLQDDCAVFKGMRRGNAWDEFKLKHANKAIITESELVQAEGLIAAVRKSPVAMNRISRGRPEASAFVRLVISGGEIYAPDYNKCLGNTYWRTEKPPKSSKDSVEIVIKVRADLLADDYILDLKSTTGNAKSPWLMAKKVSDYHYDLSAALYLDIFSLVSDRLKTEFYWTFASKDCFNAKTYLATAENIMVGRAKWKKAVLALAENIKNDWQFEDTLGMLAPQGFELSILREIEERDLL
jgi:hypothetical protein